MNYSDMLGYWRAIYLNSEGAVNRNKTEIRRVLPTAKMIALSLLKLGYGLNGAFYRGNNGKSVWNRTTPSAGAIYPIEVFVFLKGESDTFYIYLYKIDSSEFCYYGRAGLFENEQLDNSNILILFNAAPQSSVLKYGTRGYYYSLLDTAHALFNTNYYATNQNYSPILISRFNKADVLHKLKLDHGILEPVAFLAIKAEVDLNGAADIPDSDGGIGGISASEVCIDDLRALMGMPGDVEISTRNLINPRTSVDFGNRSGVNPNTKFTLCNSKNIRFAMINRSSARRFNGLPMDVSNLENTLSIAIKDIIIDYDINTNNAIDMKIILLNTTRKAGVYSYDFSRMNLQYLHPVDKLDNLSGVFMNQEWVASANAVLLLSSNGFGRDFNKNVFFERILNAVMFAHYLYLSSTVNEVGVSCIGAFDQSKLKSIAGLAEDLEIMYVMAIGNDLDAESKNDREEFHNISSYRFP